MWYHDLNIEMVFSSMLSSTLQVIDLGRALEKKWSN